LNGSIARNPKTDVAFSDYDALCHSFSWESIRQELNGLPANQGLNIAHEAVDRHASSERADITALRWIDERNLIHDYSYRWLACQSARFANVLRSLGVNRGDTVCSLLGRVPSLYVAALGTFKNVSVFCPLFSQFGVEPVLQRLKRGAAKVLVTTASHYRKKVLPILDELPELKFVLLIDIDSDQNGKVLSLSKMMEKVTEEFIIPATAPEETALLHFTSGTTGMPKGAIHAHQAVLMHYATGKYVLDFQQGDKFWCTADPGWVTGTSYGIIAPLLHGITNVVDEAEFDAARWYRILQDERVTVWYTAPTAIRRLMRIPGKPCTQYDLKALRLILSVGEPLNPEAVAWGTEALGLPIHDNWWQTETGGIMISNYRSMEIRPGSMGKPVPGVQAAIIQRKGESIEVIEKPGIEGELALHVGWPSMFRGYLNEQERYSHCFMGDWYLSGDLARRDADGYYWFVGRSDDIIKTSGHMVGPFEVESALMEHPAIAEAGVIGKPDPLIGQIVKAFVVLKQGVVAGEELRLTLLGYGRKRLGSAVAPKEIEIVTDLPKTRSGKVMRRLLKARELGLPEGDISTLEGTS
jgi:acetyl-CoA synthetase